MARGLWGTIEVVETMAGAKECSNRISDMISVIDGIACQTNILALNAAVEAARTGERAEIDLASAKRNAGVPQVRPAIAHIDQATQPNAAPVEERATTAEGPRGQAQQFIQAVCVFKLA